MVSYNFSKTSILKEAVIGTSRKSEYPVNLCLGSFVIGCSDVQNHRATQSTAYPSNPVSVQSASELSKTLDVPTSSTRSTVQTAMTNPSSKHLLRDSPSPGSQLSRNRAASVNSATSTDTYQTNKSFNVDSVLVTLSLNSEPIQIPNNINEDVFTEQLTHFEETHMFGVRYSALNDIEQVKNPYLPDPGVRYNIDANNNVPVPNHPFAIAAADDMRNLGAIIQSIYTAGSAKIVDWDGDFMETTISGLFETGGGYMSYDIAPSGKISVCSIFH